MRTYIWQQTDWPEFQWDSEQIVSLLGEARNLQGRLLGKMEALGFNLRNEAFLDTLTLDVVKSSEIEGEFLNPDQVRSSIARRLGLEFAGSVESDRHVDGVVEMMLDATQNCPSPLTAERLFNWHAALFPTGRSGMFKITVAEWRTDSTGPMQVVSGAAGKEKVHFQAPDASSVEKEMNRFLEWFNHTEKIDLVLKAAIAHVWFVTIHPFEDGNGRIGRALSEKALAQCLGQPSLIALAYTIERHRKRYYEMLELSNKENEVTDWLIWFAETILEAQALSLKRVDFHIAKARFYETFRGRLNERQQKAIARMFREGIDGFKGGLSAENYMTMTGASSATTTRDLQTLVEVGALTRTGERRYTRYFLSLN